MLKNKFRHHKHKAPLWCAYVEQMADDDRWPKKMLNWILPRRRKQARPKRSLKEDMRCGMETW